MPPRCLARASISRMIELKRPIRFPRNSYMTFMQSEATIIGLMFRSSARAKLSLHAIASRQPGSVIHSKTTADAPRYVPTLDRHTTPTAPRPHVLATAPSALILQEPSGGGNHFRAAGCTLPLASFLVLLPPRSLMKASTK
jgi:hypothetical protein